jgi:hypothetical protein
MKLLPLVAAAALLPAIIAACGGSSPSTPSAGDILQQAQLAVQESLGYRIKVTGHNLVLPQWGGVDGGTVQVGTQPAIAVAELERTGDGDYALLLFAGQTFFRRSTCDHLARVPGGGADVLTPFLWGVGGILGKATDPQFSAGPRTETIIILAEIEPMGPVQIELDPATNLPKSLVTPPDPVSGSEDKWLFSDWGAVPELSAPPANLPDQAPGGNPC